MQSEDPNWLYERAVQCPEAEIDFVESRFQALRGRPARRLREDFCGSAAVCAEWVARHPENLAIGVDKDPEILNWAREQRIQALPREQQRRIHLYQADVREDLSSTPAQAVIKAHPLVSQPLLDICLAMNFSYWLFRDRASLRDYFERVRARLADDGVFFLDAYGGYDAPREITEEREIEDAQGCFTYIWEQARFNPIDAEMDCFIHFVLPDGRRLDRAFAYSWRLWTLPEIRELLEEAGFSRVTLYWQGWDEHGEADGDFQPATTADADAGWICYISAEK